MRLWWQVTQHPMVQLPVLRDAAASRSFLQSMLPRLHPSELATMTGGPAPFSHAVMHPTLPVIHDAAPLFFQ